MNDFPDEANLSDADRPESFLRARQQMETAPKGPVYACLDANIKEEEI